MQSLQITKNNVSILLTAGKVSAGLQCPPLGFALWGRNGLLRVAQKTAVRMIVSQANKFNEPRLSLCTLKERRLFKRREYIVLPVHEDKTSCVTRSNGLKLQEEKLRLAAMKNLHKTEVLMVWSRFSSGAASIPITEGFNTG